MKKLLNRIILLVCICVFAYSAFQLGMIILQYKQIEDETNELIEHYAERAEGEDPLKRKIDFDGLLKRNSDVIGWLYIPDTKIDEPILKGNNNDSYLHTTIDRGYSAAGQVFIDKMNEKDFKDDNTIIYGHNMKNGSRFHDIRYFIEKDYYNDHPNVYIYLPDSTVNVYKTYSAGVISAESKLYIKGIDYKDYISKSQKAGSQRSDVSDEQQPLIMLSTCNSANSKEKRNVVFARLEENVKIGD